MKKNVFQKLEEFHSMLTYSKTSPMFSDQEKVASNIWGGILEHGKMFLVDHESTFDPIPFPVKWQNLPFPIMYIVFRDIVYGLIQESVDHNPYVFVAISVNDRFEPFNVRGEFYKTKSDDMLYRAYANEDINSYVNLSKDNEEFINMLLSDARYLLAIINSPTKARVSANKTPSRKCRPGERRFKARFSVIGLPSATSETAKKADGMNSGKTVSLHFRRGHYRKLPNKTVWVRSCKVGSIKNGISVQQYKVGK